jgi:alpha-L-rhamnosidase
MALRAMAELGVAVGDRANAARYNATWAQLVPRFEQRFWNSSRGTWASDPMELQTLTVLSLAAGVGSVADRASAVAALDRDVRERGYHLTVGSAGVKWLLRTLSKEGKHDTALQLAMQTTFPSWGWWIHEGATTCWESWSGVADPSHTSHPTHNHVS